MPLSMCIFNTVQNVTSILKEYQKGNGIKIHQDSCPETKARMAPEKHVKHTRKPQYVFPSKKVRKEGRGGSEGSLEEEEKEEEEEEEEEGRGQSGDCVSLNMSLGWDRTSSGVGSGSMSKASVTRSLRDGRQTTGVGVGGGWDGASCQSEEGPANHVSPTSSRDSEEDDQAEDSDSSRGTVVSLSTSLPIVFSGLQQLPKPLAPGTAATGSSTTSSGPTARDLTSPTQPTAKTTLSLLNEPAVANGVLHRIAPTQSQGLEKCKSGFDGCV